MANSHISVITSSFSTLFPCGQTAVQPPNLPLTTVSSLTTTDRSGRQDILINALTTIAGRADARWWHLSGNNNAGHNESSVSHLLGINHDDVVLIPGTVRIC